MKTNPRRLPLSVLLLIGLALSACTSSSESQRPGPQVLLTSDIPQPSPTPTRIGAPDLKGQSIILPVVCLEDSLAAPDGAVWQVMLDYAEAINLGGGLFGAELELELVELSINERLIEGETSREVEALPSLALPLLVFCDAASEQQIAGQLGDLGLVAVGYGAANLGHYAPGGPLLSANPLPYNHFSYWVEILADDWEGFKPQGAGSEIQLATLTGPDFPVIGFAHENLSEQGIEIVYQGDYSDIETLNVFDFVYAARDAQASAVFVHAEPAVAAELVNAVNALGLQDRLPLLLTSSSVSGEFRDLLFSPVYLEGVFVSASFPAWDQVDITKVRAIAESNNSINQADYIDAFFALQALDLARYALEEAIIADGSIRVDANSVREALSQSTAIYGLLINPDTQFLEATQTLNHLQILRYSETGLSLEAFRKASAVPEIILTLEAAE